MDEKQVVPPTREEVWKLVDAGEELGGFGRAGQFDRTFRPADAAFAVSDQR